MRIILASAVLTAGILAGGAAAADAPVVAKADAKAPVTVTDNGPTWVLDNGIVKARIDKRTGNMASMVYHGVETMAGNGGVVDGGYWEENPSAAAQVNGLTDSLTIDPKTNNGDRAEVSVKGVTGGKVGLSPGSPGAPTTGTFNLDLEVRYTLGRGESGIYAYAIFSHPAGYGPLNVPESRYVTKLTRTFDWLSVDADRNMLMCSGQDIGAGVVVHAKEQRILSTGIYKNSVEHKYSYTAIQYKVPAFGWSSTKDHIGVFFINPTTEFLSGGASKQELVCHMGSCILDYWRGTHYGGGASCNMAAGEEWSKVIGPIFVYCNSLSGFETPAQSDLDTLAATAGNPTLPPAWRDNGLALWQDALSQAKTERARWPYDWVNGVDYPHKDQRGGVTGRIVLSDPQAATAKMPNLTIGLSHPDYAAIRAGGFGGRGGRGPATNAALARGGPATNPAFAGRGRGFGGFGGNGTVDWKHDAKFYQFWADGTEDGQFAINDVRPGTYTLHAFADGVLSEFAQANITVTAGQNLDLGKLEWTPVRFGKQVWDIGYPDRTGGKFFKGDGADYWLWGWCLRYPLLFPNDLTYTIGQSDYHKDWFFEEVPHGTADPKLWVNPNAKDPANQRFGWVKTESLDQYPQTNERGPWANYGLGRATTWTVKFNMDHAPKGQAALRIALAGADGGGGLAIGVNGKTAGTLYPTSTNALRYNTDKSVWQELTQKFDATMMKQGENEMTFTVPAGELTTGVVWDYLRLELNEDYKP